MRDKQFAADQTGIRKPERSADSLSALTSRRDEGDLFAVGKTQVERHGVLVAGQDEQLPSTAQHLQALVGSVRVSG
jgi:hypothetical protein